MKETIRVLLGVLLVSVATAAHAQYICTTNNGTITITGYTGSGGSLTIPTNINGLTVTDIGSNAFEGDNLVFVTIPITITNIGDNAFADCFGLSMVSIGNGVLTIGFDAFGGCTELNNLTIGTNVNSIGAAAFSFCPLSDSGLGIPNSVVSIGDSAFAASKLTSASISTYVTNLGGNPFSACTSVTSISVATNNAYYTNVSGIVYTKDQSTIVAYPAGKAGSSYTISNYVTTIGTDAFNGCNNLTNVVIPASVTSIAGPVFLGCNNLLGINVATNNTVYSSLAGVLFNAAQTTLIEYPLGNPQADYAFPDGVTNIGDNAFAGCRMSNLTFPDTLITIGASAFDICLNLTSVSIPPSVTNIETEAFEECMNLSNITLPNSITSIAEDTFSGSGLTSIAIPMSVTNIGIGAFSLCLDLTNVIIPASVTAIAEGTFSACTKLPDIIIPASVTNIGDYSFSDCTSLKGVYFEGNAPSADSIAFFADTKATVYYLPDATGWGTNFDGLPTALWTPSIQASGTNFGVQSNQFGFNIFWASNESVTVQASTSLTSPSWTALTDVILTNGTFYFSDANWTNYPNRYYRLSWP